MFFFFFKLFFYYIATFFDKKRADKSRKNWLLDAEKFETFLNEEQRDPSLNELLYPFCTTEKSAELIQKFEIEESSRRKSNQIF